MGYNVTYIAKFYRFWSVKQKRVENSYIQVERWRYIDV